MNQTKYTVIDIQDLFMVFPSRHYLAIDGPNTHTDITQYIIIVKQGSFMEIPRHRKTEHA